MDQNNKKKKNVFVKPNEQSDARISSAMARKGRMKSKSFLSASFTRNAFPLCVAKVLHREGGKDFMGRCP